MNKSEQINELASALSKFQGEALNPTKDKKGYNYTYADLASLLEVTRPLLEKNGLAVAQMPFNNENLIGVETMLTHSSGQWLSSSVSVPVESAQKMSIAQASGSVITYLRRYSYAAFLGIAQDDDDAQTQMTKKDFMKSATSGKPTKEQLERLMAITPEEKKQSARDWFNSQTQKSIEDYLRTQENNNAA
jgi:hypothetical protein